MDKSLRQIKFSFIHSSLVTPMIHFTEVNDNQFGDCFRL